MKQLISICVPVLNEAANIAPLLDRLAQVLPTLQDRFDVDMELVVTDNCSTDGTFDIIQSEIEQRADLPFAVRAFRFARNIGFQKSILAGYTKARGAAVVQIDADLQDPPELIGDFIEKWRDGYQVVFGVRTHREEGKAITWLRKGFYRLLDMVSDDPLPHDSGDFRLIDRSLVDVVIALRDHDPYLRGGIASLGMKQIGVPYRRTARQRGESKFRLYDLIRLGWDAVTNHSVVPLRLSTWFAVACFCALALLSVYFLLIGLFGSGDLPLGYVSTMLVLLGGFGFVSLLLGLQGQYVARIYSQLKERPLAIVVDQISSEADEDAKPAVEVMWSGKPGG